MHACAKPWRWRWIAPPFTRCCCNGRAKSPAPCCRNGIAGKPLRQGEISGALLPQWLSGYAFLFPGAADLGRARQLASGARPITLGVSDATARPIAERIVLNARDAGLAVSVTPQAANADVVLLELRIASADPEKALAQL